MSKHVLFCVLEYSSSSEILFVRCNETAAHFHKKSSFCFGLRSFMILGRVVWSSRKVRVRVSIVVLLLDKSKEKTNSNTHFTFFTCNIHTLL
jgi:hypothetical protein